MFGRVRLKMTCLLGKLLLVIHMGVAGSLALRRLWKKWFKRTSSSAQLNIIVAVVLSQKKKKVELQRIQEIPDVSQPHLVNNLGN